MNPTLEISFGPSRAGAYNTMVELAQEFAPTGSQAPARSSATPSLSKVKTSCQSRWAHSSTSVGNSRAPESASSAGPLDAPTYGSFTSCGSLQYGGAGIGGEKPATGLSGGSHPFRSAISHVRTLRSSLSDPAREMQQQSHISAVGLASWSRASSRMPSWPESTRRPVSPPAISRRWI